METINVEQKLDTILEQLRYIDKRLDEKENKLKELLEIVKKANL